MNIEVQTSYEFNGDFSLDEVAEKAVGRVRDFSGAGCGERDLGWVVKSRREAHEFKRALEKVGLTAEVVEE